AARGSGYLVSLGATSATLVLDSTVDSVVFQPVGAASDPIVQPESPLPGTANYLLGNDPSNWQTDVPSFGRVRYSDIYPGINLVYYGSRGEFEYDYVIAPGADPEMIAMAVSGAGNAQADSDGSLSFATSAGTIQLNKPVVYQDHADGRVYLDGHYTLADD